MRAIILVFALALSGTGLAEAGPGSCRCRTDRDSAGRLCGGRSAEARPGGASPVCGTSSSAGRVDDPGPTTLANPFGSR